MKTNYKTLFVSIFFMLPFFTFAQGNQRPVSKEVQKISNKAWLKNENLLVVVSSSQTASISKDVQFKSKRIKKQQGKGNVISSGYPAWIISKGVKKISRPSIKTRPSIKKKVQEQKAERRHVIV